MRLGLTSLLAWAVAFLLVVVTPARAQVSFDEAIALSQRAPAVDARRRELAAREAGDADLGGTSQGLSITATPGARIENEQDRGFEGQLSVYHSWNLGDLTGARRRAAAAERRVIAAEQRAAALEGRLEAARQWIELWRFSRAEAVVREERALAEQLVASTERALSAGVATAMDEAEARTYAAEVMQRAIAIAGTRHDTALALSHAMGRTPDATLTPEGPLPDPSTPADPAPWMRRVERLPSVAIERLAARASSAREAEAAATYAPVFGLGAQVQRESPDGIIAQGVIVLSLPLVDQSQRQRSVDRGEAVRREAEADQARLRALRELSLAFHDVEHTERALRALEERLLPAAERLVDRRELALRAGEGTVFELAAARRQWIDARGRAIEAAAAHAWAEVRLWILLAEIERTEAR